MLVRVKSRKGHWNVNQFVPMGQTFDFAGSLDGMEDRLEPVDGPQVEAKVSVDDDAPPVEQLDWGALPKDIVGKLVGAGLDTPDKVKATSDDSLLAIAGIGPATVAAIRGQIK